MKPTIKKVKPCDKKGKCWNVIIETPKGSNVKYDYDEESGFLVVSKALPEGMVFPFNFGFVPHTLAPDGDPVDMLVFNEEPLLAGCLLQVHPVGVIKAEQSDGNETVRNDRIIGQAVPKEAPADLEELKLTKKMVSQVEFFFKAYNAADGKKFKVLGTGGAGKAREIIKQGVKAALRRRKNRRL